MEFNQMINQQLPPNSFAIKHPNGKTYPCSRVIQKHGDYFSQVITVIGVGKINDKAIYRNDYESLNTMISRSKLLADYLISNGLTYRGLGHVFC
jgi:hypothetical protein